MESLLVNPAFDNYVIAVILITIKMFMVGAYTGFTRRRLKAYINPEDARLFKFDERHDEHDAIKRLHRLHRNDLENIPAFYAVGLVYTLAVHSETGAKAYFGTYIAARVVHSLAYLNHLQPWRSLAWMVGQLAMMGMMVQSMHWAMTH